MESVAKGKFIKISARKARVVANAIRGKYADEALNLLEVTHKAAAPIIKKLINSAIANARQKEANLDVSSLYVKTIFVDKGPMKHMRRWRPRAMGRATRINKGVSHITLILEVA